ncbi:MAG: tRNA lysidine(34) synthetase TilS [Bacillota bacterium]
MDLYKKFKKNILDIAGIKKNNKLLLSVSGGPDSLVMFDLSLRLRDEYEIGIGVFHLDHQLREESEVEAEMVKDYCEDNNLDYWIEKEDILSLNIIKSGSIESIAREVRLKHLNKIYNENKFDAVLTGHQANDQVETVLFNLFRGSGLEGLSGMDITTVYQKMFLVKPLLNIWRKEIEIYCIEKGLNPNIDNSNYTLKYSRNRIRNELIPYLEENFNDSIKSTLFETINIINDEHKFINRIVNNTLDELTVESGEEYLDLDIKRLYNEDISIQRRIIRKAILKVKGSLDGIYQKHINILVNAIEDEIESEETGKDYQLPEGLICRVEYNIISFRSEGWSNNISYYSRVLSGLGEYLLADDKFFELKKFNINDKDWRKASKDNIVFVDYDKVEWPLILRHRKKGDRFKPLNMNGTKKIKDFFIDEKFPKHIRDRIPILVDGKGRIIWIVGERLDDRFKITSRTQNILMLKYELNKKGDY